METRGQRVTGGFPGYTGPALPRAVRSSRGRVESARLQSTGGGHSGVFELLATVAGQFLQDAGSKKEDRDDEVKPGHQESQKPTLETKSLVLPHAECAMDDCLAAQEQQIPVPPSIASQVDTPTEVRTKEEPEQVDREHEKEVDGSEHVESHPEIVTNKSALSTPSQDKEDEVVAKDIPAKEGNAASAASAQNKSTELGDQVFLLQSDSILSSAKFDHGFDTASSMAIKESMHVPEVQTGGAEIEQSSGMAMQETEAPEQMPLMNSTDLHSPGLGIELPPFLEQQKQNSLPVESNKPVEGLQEDVECSQVLGKFEAGIGHAHVGDVILENGLSQVQCKTSASCEAVQLAKPIDVSIVKREEKTTVTSEEKKPHLLAGATSFMVTTSGLQGHDTRPMFKRVKSKRDAKFFKQETVNHHHLRSSPRLVQETMTKRLKNSFSKGLKSSSRRLATKVLKTSPLSGRRRKRQQHVDIGSADSGSSGDAVFAQKTFFGGIGGLPGQQRTTRGLLAKRMKMVDGRSKPSSELHLNTSCYMEMGFDCVDGEPPAAAAKLRSAKAASVASSPTVKGASKRSSKNYCEPHVKLSIKSFAVPELFVDLPESASVANLKRAVMDAAMSLLGGGLRVRVLMQGKKVPDEGATLLQMGISRTAKPESLDFMLEPSPLPSSPSTSPEDPLLVLSRAANQPSLRYPVFGLQGLAGDVEGGCGASKGRLNKGNSGTALRDAKGASSSPDEHDNVDAKQAGRTYPVAPPDTLSKGFGGAKNKKTSTERIPHGSSLVSGSGAIILHPGLGAGDDGLTAMALVPLPQKIAEALDIGKRRVRRPFSVTEVEALVHSVEKLGTGRWRDIKLRSFDQAKHRTYVDLKDKWKTLVHTAQIAPHQRRGEPVPQELLERVIRIHIYWTAQAAKQQAELDF